MRLRLVGAALLVLAAAACTGCGGPELTPHGRMLVETYDAQVVDSYVFRSPWHLAGLAAFGAFAWWFAGRRGEAGAREWERLAAWAVSRETALVAGLCVSAAVLAAWLAIGPLDGVPHIQDERSYMFTARMLAQGRLWVPALDGPLKQAAAIDFTVMDGPKWYGRFPPGWPAVLALGVRAGAPELVNAALLVLVLLGLHGFVRRRVGVGGALVTTALAAGSPLLVFAGASHMPHLAALACLLAALWAWETERAAVAGLAAGALFLVRPHEGVLVALVAGAGFAARRRWAWAAPFAALLAVGLAYNAALTGDPWVPPTLKFYPGDRPGFFAEAGVYRAEGHNLARGLHNVRDHFVVTNDVLFGWAFCSLLPAAVGLAVLARRREATRLEAALLALSALYVAVLLCFHNPGFGYGTRYHIFLMPVLLWLTARGLAWLAALGDGRGATATAVCVAYLSVQAAVTHWPPRVAELHGYWGVRALAIPKAEQRPVVIVRPRSKDDPEWFDAFEAVSTPWEEGEGPVALRDGPGVEAAARRAFPRRVVVYDRGGVP